jgi:2-haloacid dehalogenase
MAPNSDSREGIATADVTDRGTDKDKPLPRSKTSKTTNLDFTRFKALTFDCYGTLIDWESGLLGALRPVLEAHGHKLSDREILDIYGELEPALQNPYRRYRQVLAEIMRGFAERLGFQLTNGEAESLPDSLKNWQPFPDTCGALEKLKTRFKLAIISNTDDDFFSATSKHLGVKFDEVVTAEQAKAYKPSAMPFRMALERLGMTREEVLHVGQSVYHDVLPARLLGMATVLVHRRGHGATRQTEGEPDLKVPDLETLAELALE